MCYFLAVVKFFIVAFRYIPVGLVIYIETGIGYIMVSLTEEHNMTNQQHNLDRIRCHADYTRVNCETIHSILADALTETRLGRIERLLCDIKVDMKMIDEHAKDIAPSWTEWPMRKG